MWRQAENEGWWQESELLSKTINIETSFVHGLERALAYLIEDEKSAGQLPELPKLPELPLLPLNIPDENCPKSTCPIMYGMNYVVCTQCGRNPIRKLKVT